jgi:hypothetical protein
VPLTATLSSRRRIVDFCVVLLQELVVRSFQGQQAAELEWTRVSSMLCKSISATGKIDVMDLAEECTLPVLSAAATLCTESAVVLDSRCVSVLARQLFHTCAH